METLIEQERKARLSNNEEEIKQIFVKMLSVSQDDAEILSIAKSLCKRKTQLKNPFKWFINHIFSLKKDIIMQKKPGTNESILFLKSLLKDVIEGKMFLEEERILICSFLRDLYLEIRDVNKALEVVFEVPVETFTSIPEEQILDFQLEQFRLSILSKDLVKAEICSKKIRNKYFLEHKDIKNQIKYESCMAELLLGQESYIEASKIFLSISEISDPRLNVILSSFFCLISERSEARNNQILLLMSNKNNSEPVRKILGKFLKPEIVGYDDVLHFKTYDFINFEELSLKLRRSIDSYNLYVLSRFFTVISVSDLSKLMQCGDLEVIEKVSHEVNNKNIFCKIDQENQLVRFNKSLEPDWMECINNVLDRLVEVNHLIHIDNLKYA